MLFNFAVEFSQVASGQNITDPVFRQQSSSGVATRPPRLRFQIRQLQIVDGTSQYVDVWESASALGGFEVTGINIVNEQYQLRLNNTYSTTFRLVRSVLIPVSSFRADPAYRNEMYYRKSR